MDVIRHEEPFDPGLQVERTLLAWRRTALAVAVVNAASIRFTVHAIGVWTAVVAGTLGVGLAMIAYLATGARYRQVNRSLNRSAALPSAGWPQATLAAASAALGVVALAFILSSTG